MPGVAPHHRQEEPPAGSHRVLHEVVDEILAQVNGRREPEGGNVVGQGQIVVDGLGHMGQGERAAQRLGDAGGSERRVVAADGHQVGGVEAAQRVADGAGGLG